jgi:xylan 1,4-beta-xylosidase
VGVLLWNGTLDHGDVRSRWQELGGGADRPDGEQWRALAAADRLDEAEPPRAITPGRDITLELPNPGIVLLEIR